MLEAKFRHRFWSISRASMYISYSQDRSGYCGGGDLARQKDQHYWSLRSRFDRSRHQHLAASWIREEGCSDRQAVYSPIEESWAWDATSTISMAWYLHKGADRYRIHCNLLRSLSVRQGIGLNDLPFIICVDDACITSSSGTLIQDVMDQLKRRFKVT